MYKLTPYATIIRMTDGANIPPDPNNSDYAAYVSWLGAGFIPMSMEEEKQWADEPMRPAVRPARVFVR